MSRLTTPFIGVALVAGAFWVATQSYQKNFSGPALDDAQQAELGIQLIEFPRQVPPLERLEQGQWHAIRLQPSLCDAVCQGQMVQQTAAGIHVVPPSQAVYQDLLQVTSAENYAAHQGHVLLLNKEGRFAGSLLPPYNKDRVSAVLQTLNH
ncbi:hypothetical protein MAQ5080_01445 [Marinomonas aquimarina]|uniref:Uncharacterized protein n=1 Tax=Marinomonas aquimarina TaxID=295068 RepID=A0A1A8TBR7_9GAMM|nr:hypothetical protein [Marinomonas aquimarina]SBS29612.1 hypothetical protein MAQ5080_01445 [Marinomonas aquimarina]